MGIRINVNARQDYSYLFQSMTTSRGNSLGNLNFLSDYASIKNGSYGKLMKAYYAKDAADKTASKGKDTETKKNSISTAADSAKTLSEIEKAADAMKESADSLLVKGSKSVFRKKNEKATVSEEYDTDAIYKAVSGFVTDYNDLLSKTSAASSKNLQSKADTLAAVTSANAKLLSRVGITVNSDSSLSLDEEAFKKSDMGTVKNLFGTTGAYGYKVSAQASMIDYTAAKESTKSNTYTANGTYSNVYSAGNILNSFF
ncbi:hypothetical protein DXB46_10310 [Lachnospiraceae bacterium OM04-12BH]|nr:hypothetical protein DXB46_10310 [Lachnospiraceae bacterium OM04-12BH]